jgi:LysM repeat protein
MGSYCRTMKRISIFLAIALLAVPAVSRAQDAATEERFNKLSAKIDVLIESRDAQNRKIEELARAIESLQQQAGRPSPNYASQEDVKLLAEKLKEVDRKRQEDNDRILDSIKRELASAIRTPSPRPTPAAGDTSSIPDKGYEHVVKEGETLSAIIAAYRENNVKVTLDQVLKANPGLKPTQMRVGQKVFIPAP